MFDLSTVVTLLIILSIAALFWQFRQQAERAQIYAAHYCKQHQLQLLDIARTRGRLVWLRRGPAWQAEFRFGFTSDKEQRYEGTLQMINLQLKDVSTPVFREPTF